MFFQLHRSYIGLARTIHTVYIRYSWQGNCRINGHIRRVYTVLANPPIHLCVSNQRTRHPPHFHNCLTDPWKIFFPITQFMGLCTVILKAHDLMTSSQFVGNANDIFATTQSINLCRLKSEALNSTTFSQLFGKPKRYLCNYAVHGPVHNEIRGPGFHHRVCAHCTGLWMAWCCRHRHTWGT